MALGLVMMGCCAAGGAGPSETAVAGESEGSKRIDVTALGADPTGRVDSTAAIQRALDASTDGRVVVLPPGRYRTSGLVVRDVRDLEILGHGATLVLEGTPTPGERVGIRLDGVIEGLLIDGLSLRGDGRTEHRHAGIWSSSRARLTGVRIRRVAVSDVTLGIALAGRLRDVEVDHCKIERTVGTEPGFGYGISVSEISGEKAQVRIVGNTVRGATRHSIYQARGRGITIADNDIHDHRTSVASGAMRPAVVIARSSDVSFTRNRVERFFDGGLLVSSAPGLHATRISIVDNAFSEPGNSVAPIIIGNHVPEMEGAPGEVLVSHNRVVGSWTSGPGLIRIRNARLANVTGNRMALPWGCPTVVVEGHGEADATARYTHRVRVVDNVVVGYTLRGPVCLQIAERAASSSAIIETTQPLGIARGE